MMVKNIEKLRKNLPRGFSRHVIEKFGISKTMLTFMLKGQRTMKPDILAFLIELAEENKKKIDGLNKRLKNL